MKCDAGEIACAIDRLTDAVNGVSAFDWWAGIGIPLILGVLTLVVTAGVAIASVLVARRSNALARQSNALARLSINLARKAEEASAVAEQLEFRRNIGLDLVALLQMLQHLGIGMAQPEIPTLRSKVRAKLAFSGEAASDKILEDTSGAFRGIDPFSAEGRAAVERASERAKFGIEVWVREPDKYLDWVSRRDHAEAGDEVSEPDLSQGS